MACYWAWEWCKLPQWSPPAAKGFDAFCVDLSCYWHRYGTKLGYCHPLYCYYITCSDFKFAVGDIVENPIHTAEADMTETGLFCRV